jgi:hypothetical protein
VHLWRAGSGAPTVVVVTALGAAAPSASERQCHRHWPGIPPSTPTTAPVSCGARPVPGWRPGRLGVGNGAVVAHRQAPRAFRRLRLTLRYSPGERRRPQPANQRLRIDRSSEEHGRRYPDPSDSQLPRHWSRPGPDSTRPVVTRSSDLSPRNPRQTRGLVGGVLPAEPNQYAGPARTPSQLPGRWPPVQKFPDGTSPGRR